MSEQVMGEFYKRVAKIKQTINRLQQQPSSAEHRDTLTILKANTEDIESVLTKVTPGKRFEDIANELGSQLTETEQFLVEIGEKNE